MRSELEVNKADLSRRAFVLSIAMIVCGFIAFPIYQFFITGGPLFYVNGIDEPSYLSYPFASYTAGNMGAHRILSRLVVDLHNLGLSGGYCNLLFDLIITPLVIFCAYIALKRGNVVAASARRVALLTFLGAFFFNPTNPLIKALDQWHYAPSLITWTVVPFNAELPFARSPEPQLSWFIVTLWLALLGGTRWLHLSAFIVAPFLYSFVRLPFLFVAIASLIAKRLNLSLSCLISWISLGTLMGVFLSVKSDPRLAWYVTASRLPMLPFTGVVSLALYLFIRGGLPENLKKIVPILVVSTWVGPNIQVISGAFAAPVNYEQYWGVVVCAFLLALVIDLRSATRNLWISLALAVFVYQSVYIFKANKAVMGKISNLPRVLEVVKSAPHSVAASEVFIASYLDLAYPRQAATVFSFNSTYAHGDENFKRYICAKRYIERNHADLVQNYAFLFEMLDNGYRVKGIDRLVNAGRSSAPNNVSQSFSFAEPSEAECGANNFELVVAAGVS